MYDEHEDDIEIFEETGKQEKCQSCGVLFEVDGRTEGCKDPDGCAGFELVDSVAVTDEVEELNFDCYRD